MNSTNGFWSLYEREQNRRKKKRNGHKQAATVNISSLYTQKNAKKKQNNNNTQENAKSNNFIKNKHIISQSLHNSKKYNIKQDKIKSNRSVATFDGTIVIDNGSGMIKAGLSNDTRPKVIFPAIVGRERLKGSRVLSCGQKDAYNIWKTEGKTYIGDDAMTKRGVLTLKSPFEKGMIDNWFDMERIWNHIFEDWLQVSSQSSSVLLTEPILNPMDKKGKTLQIMFETFGVSKLFPSIAGILALYAADSTTGMIIDAGNSAIQMIPIEEGYYLPGAVRKVNLAGRTMDICLQKILFSGRGYGFSTSAEMAIVKNIKETFCYVAVDYEKEIQKFRVSAELEKNYILPDGQTMTVGMERFKAPEMLLFHPDAIQLKHKSFIALTMESVNNCDEKLQKRQLANVVLCGGMTLLTGFTDRLRKELTPLVPNDMTLKIKASPQRQYSVWIGGTILSSLSTFKSDMISRDEYDEHGNGILYKKCIQRSGVISRRSNKALYNMDDNKYNSDVLNVTSSVLKSDTNATQSLVDELLKDQNKIQCENDILRQELSAIRLNKNKLIETITEMEKMNGSLNEEFKEMSLKFDDLKADYDKLKKCKKFDVENFLNWTYEDVGDWIINLDNGVYSQYEQKLRNVLQTDNIDGSCLDLVMKSDIKDWGITDFKHRSLLFKHILNLIHNAAVK